MLSQPHTSTYSSSSFKCLCLSQKFISLFFVPQLQLFIIELQIFSGFFFSCDCIPFSFLYFCVCFCILVWPFVATIKPDSSSNTRQSHKCHPTLLLRNKLWGQQLSVFMCEHKSPQRSGYRTLISSEVAFGVLALVLCGSGTQEDTASAGGHKNRKLT